MTPVLPSSLLQVAIVQSLPTIKEIFAQIVQEIPPHHFYSTENLLKLLDGYTEQELSLIYKDFCELRRETFEHATQTHDYIVTAGGPSSGKSTIMEEMMRGEGPLLPYLEKNLQRAYIDPDRSCLQKMKHTYLADVDKGTTSKEAYAKWRNASNFISNYFLACALRDGYAIAHGSTMATPYAKNALQAIQKTYDYTTTLLHVTCANDLRNTFEQKRRNEGMYQCTDQDFKEKQEMFLSLLPDYIEAVDKVIFCLVEQDSMTVAAILEKKVIEVKDGKALGEIIKAHGNVWNEACSKMRFFNLNKSFS